MARTKSKEAADIQIKGLSEKIERTKLRLKNMEHDLKRLIAASDML